MGSDKPDARNFWAPWNEQVTWRDRLTDWMLGMALGFFLLLDRIKYWGKRKGKV